MTVEVSLEDVLRWIDDIKEQYQRDEDQGILQGRLDKAKDGLSGKEACERLKRGIKTRFGFEENMAFVVQKRKRA